MADELTQLEAYRTEVERALNEDKTRLGDVWKLSQQGLEPEKIAAELNVSTSGFVSSYKTYIKAIKDGNLPGAPWPAKHCTRAIRSFAKRHKASLSPATHSELQNRADRCDLNAADSVKLKEEEQKLEHQTSVAEKEGVPGIYVYTLPHYLRHPVENSENDETDDRTYLKVGMSEKDAIKRFRQQQGSTALPESPILLRIYVGSNGIDIADVEKKVHRHLNAADHVKNSERGAGQEWFLTHLKFLDSTAELLGLQTHFAFDKNEA